MSYFNMVCDSCGRVVQGITWVNGMKFCAKCYRETFGNNTSKFADLLNSEMYELKISNLEYKLNEKDQRIAKLEEQLTNSIVPKFKIGQTLYMIPTQSNGLSKIKDYILLSVSLSDIGIRYDLSLKEKEKGIEPFYCASEDMFEKSIFATKEEAEQKLAEIGGKDE